MKLIIKNGNYSQGEIVKIIREWTELTQKDFAKSINKGRTTLQKYELEDVNYSMQTFLNIAKKYNLTITIEKNK